MCLNCHVVQVDIEIKSLEALDEACHRLGLIFKRGQTTYKWFGQYLGDSPLPQGLTPEDLGKCDHAISLPNNDRAYEVGVRRNAEGTYSLLWDFWAGGYGLQEVVGHNCHRLQQAYAAAVARMEATANGYDVQETQDAQGTIHLTLTSWS